MAEGEGAGNSRLVLIIVVLASFLTPFAGSSFNIALPSIAEEFGLDAVTMSWASLAYLLASAMFLVPLGRFADIHGRKRIFLLGNLFFAVFSLLLGIYPSAQTIITLRAMQGVSAAMLFGTGVAILVSVTPPKQKGTALGVYSASVYVGLSTGPFLGGFLTQVFGWRSILFATAGVGLTAALLVLFGMRGEWREAEGESFDAAGSAIYSVVLLALMYGLSLLPALSGLLPIAIALGGAWLFLVVEDRSQHPVLDIGLFRSNKVFSFSNLATLINFSATYAVTFLLSAYLQYIKALSPEEAGIVLMASPVVQAVFGPVAGRLSDRMDAKKVSAVGMGITVLGLIPFALIEEGTPIAYVVGSLAVLGLGLAVFSSPNTNVVMSSVARKLYGTASSTIATMRLAGQMLSMAITLVIFSVLIGRLEIVPEVYPALTGSIRVAFLIFVALCFLGVLACLVNAGNGSAKSESS